MLNLESSYFKEYYGENPDFYSIAFLHYSLDIVKENMMEYVLIQSDLKKVKEYTKSLFKIYFSELNTFLNFINNTRILDNYFEDIYLRINSALELNELNKYEKLFNLKVIVSYSDISKYDKNFINKFKIIIQIDTVKELSINDLIDLQKNYNVEQVIVGQICYLSSYFKSFLKRIGDKFNINYLDQLNIEKHALISNDNYSIDEYIKIYKALEILCVNIEETDEVEKFKVIYEKIINKINYNFDGVKNTELSNQNLVGGLFNNSCVCEGYSKILQQVLSLVSIESIVVGGGGTKEDDGHIWNQVKINGNWYNVDASYDSIQVHNDKPAQLCLVSDEVLYYKTDYLMAKECNNNYNFNLKK